MNSSDCLIVEKLATANEDITMKDMHVNSAIAILSLLTLKYVDAHT